jgi:hypothetical protein
MKCGNAFHARLMKLGLSMCRLEAVIRSGQTAEAVLVCLDRGNRPYSIVGPVAPIVRNSASRLQSSAALRNCRRSRRLRRLDE